MLTLAKNLLFLALAVLLGGFAWSRTQFRTPPPAASLETGSIVATVHEVDQAIRAQWHRNSVDPTDRASDLTLARRAALALVGTIPSLEEIRWIESQPRDTRLAKYVERLLADPRFSHTLAERLMDGWLPRKDDENFIMDRRARFHRWLVNQIESHRACDAIVRDMLTANGLWTTEPAVMFITASKADPVQLAGAASRAFLGISMDCAECHDHPFAPWKQSQFRGFAAYFGQTKVGLAGVTDGGAIHRFTTDTDPKGEYVLPAAPCPPSLAINTGNRRQQVAEWITSLDNPRFAQVTTNRVWKMVFGQGLVEPVDDLGGTAAIEGVLDILADDFRTNGHDLRRLFRVLLATEAFERSSELEQPAEESQSLVFAAFPVSRLAANDIARGVIQMSSLRTINEDTSVLLRAIAFFERMDFLRYFQGDKDDTSGTVAQRLMLMNGALVAQRTRADGALTAGRLEHLAPSDAACVETAFLIALTRLPTEAEKAHFVARIKEAKPTQRGQVIEDLLWALVNSTQFQSLW